MAARKASTKPKPATGALSIRYVPVDSLKPYPKNARVHSAEQISQIAASMGEFGVVNPLLIDEAREIIAGHGRLEAVRRLGMATVPTIMLRGLSAAQKKALRIADNRLALSASWDEDLLRSEIGDLQLGDFDLDLLGFGDGELADLLGDGSDGSGAGAFGSLSARFGVPPFSVLNAREGWWQERKRAWIALGIRSELGRGDTPGTSARAGPGKKPNAVPGGQNSRSTAQKLGGGGEPTPRRAAR
jgi:ParB-like nuclease family protein